MAVINKLPLGWLGFFGIKNGGRYPEEASSVLSPTWDMAQLYLYTNAIISSDLLSASAVGSLTFKTVPNGEVWAVLLQAAQSATLTAGQSFQMCTNWTDPAVTTNIENGQSSILAGVGGRATCINDRVFFAGPGSRLGITCNAIAAGPVNVTLKLQYAVMQM